MKKLFLFALFAALCCSCSESGTDETTDPDPTLEIFSIQLSHWALKFPPTGGKESVRVYYEHEQWQDKVPNDQWQLTGGESWCTASKTNGGYGEEVVFEVTENKGFDERTTTFTFTCGTVSKNLVVTQGREDVLFVTPTQIDDVDANGGELKIEVKTNTDKGVYYECGRKIKGNSWIYNDWIKYQEKKISTQAKTTTFVFDVMPYSQITQTASKRYGTITIYCFDKIGEYMSREVSVSQQSEVALNITMHVPQKGMLEEVLADYDYTKIGTLKITGILNDVDFLFIRNKMPNLKCLDISEVNLTELPAKVFYESTVEKLILPNSLVTIGEKAFYESALNSVIIPTGVTTIGGGAFMNCKALTSIVIPAKVEKIETETFNGCSQLATVTFEKGSQLKTIGGGYSSSFSYYYGAFTDCTALTAIEIPASVETIEEMAFAGCTKLATVTFGKGSQLKTIGGASRAVPNGYVYYGAFKNCGVTSIEIPASVEKIETAAFMGCSKLATVTFEKGTQLKTINERTFCASGLTSIEIPASVETIEEAAFNGCSQLATVTFEKGSQLKVIYGDYSFAYGAFCGSSLKTVDMSECTQVRTIGAYAFSYNSQLQLFKIGTKTPPSCGLNAFDGINLYSILKVPSGSIDAYKAATGWNSFASITGLDE